MSATPPNDDVPIAPEAPDPNAIPDAPDAPDAPEAPNAPDTQDASAAREKKERQERNEKAEREIKEEPNSFFADKLKSAYEAEDDRELRRKLDAKQFEEESIEREMEELRAQIKEKEDKIIRLKTPPSLSTTPTPPSAEPPSPVSAASTTASSSITNASSRTPTRTPSPTLESAPEQSKSETSHKTMQNQFQSTVKKKANELNIKEPEEFTKFEKENLVKFLVELRTQNENYKSLYEKPKDEKKQTERTGTLFFANTKQKYQNSQKLHAEINAMLISSQGKKSLTVEEVKRLLNKYKELDQQSMGYLSRAGQVNKMLTEAEAKLTNIENALEDKKPEQVSKQGHRKPGQGPGPSGG